MGSGSRGGCSSEEKSSKVVHAPITVKACGKEYSWCQYYLLLLFLFIFYWTVLLRSLHEAHMRWGKDGQWVI